MITPAYLNWRQYIYQNISMALQSVPNIFFLGVYNEQENQNEFDAQITPACYYRLTSSNVYKYLNPSKQSGFIKAFEISVEFQIILLITNALLANSNTIAYTIAPQIIVAILNTNSSAQNNPSMQTGDYLLVGEEEESSYNSLYKYIMKFKATYIDNYPIQNIEQQTITPIIQPSLTNG